MVDDYNEFDLSEFFEEEEAVSDPSYLVDGTYHIGIKEVEFPGKIDAANLRIVVLGSKDKLQVDKEFTHTVWFPNPEKPWSRDSFAKFVASLTLATGMRKPGEFPKISLSEDWWEQLEGKQMVAKVKGKQESYTNDNGTTIEFTKVRINGTKMFAIGSKEAKGVPINVEAAAEGGYVEGEGSI